LSPEKANPAAGLSPTRGAAPPPVSSEASTGGQSPYLAPSPSATPRSPGGGLRIRSASAKAVARRSESPEVTGTCSG
jgi:hypothetical protein